MYWLSSTACLIFAVTADVNNVQFVSLLIAAWLFSILQVRKEELNRIVDKTVNKTIKDLNERKEE